VFRLDRALQPYREAGSLNDRINLFGFIDDRVFLSKSGDVGLILAVKGVDYESLAAAEIDNYTKRLESAFKIFDEKCRVYQYLFKRSGETVSPQTYENPVVNAAIRNRADFLSSKAQDLYSLDIYYAVVMEGPQAQRAIFAALSQAPRSPRRAWQELRALLSTRRQVVLMEEEITRAQRLLVQRAENFILQVKDFMPTEILDKDRAFRVLKRLLNFSPLKIECARLKHDTFLVLLR